MARSECGLLSNTRLSHSGVRCGRKVCVCACMICPCVCARACVRACHRRARVLVPHWLVPGGPRDSPPDAPACALPWHPAACHRGGMYAPAGDPTRQKAPLPCPAAAPLPVAGPSLCWDGRVGLLVAGWSQAPQCKAARFMRSQGTKHPARVTNYLTRITVVTIELAGYSELSTQCDNEQRS